ncbi:hypothetical protein CHS0354_018239 [Potamilus streckersoni]|uniref:RING-type domain-containing protein n=1 Tax=Potamilus streckersoni TaxID=2493646 RepID=A0AAE0VX17_9BIVA|nr:hypothetical protein CHS0354_018239 [Potamilus streckersoni]
METLKINTQTSSGTEVEYFVAKNGIVDNTSPMSDCEAIEDLREKKVSLEVGQSYSSKDAETLMVKDETVKIIGYSTNSTTSEILIGKEENVKLIVKADDTAEDYIFGLDEEYVIITTDASYKEEFESCRAGSRESEREEEVESFNNIVPSDGLVIGQDCEMLDDLNIPCLQEAYRSDENQENDLFCYHDIHKGRYEHDEFDEIFESMKKKQSYRAKERKHGWSEERGVIVPCFYEDKQCLKSYPSVRVQQEFTVVTNADESLSMGREEHFEASSMNCKEMNKKTSDKSVITTDRSSDFISLESEKKAFSSELHFRNMENPLSFVSKKMNRKRMEGLIHLNEGVKLLSSRGQLVSSSLRVFFKTDNTCLHQMKDSTENMQQILSDMGVYAQKEKYVVEKDERTTRDIDLKEKKKHHLRQIVWLPRNWLPLPRLGRDEIVGFVEEQTHDVHGSSTLPPVGHEELREMLRQLASDNVPGPKITMKYEMLRLCTMKTFPGRDRPFAIRIVGAGFYYAGHKDQVICYCCGSRKEGWVLGDIPLLIHQNMAPGCGFLTHNAVVNVPIRKRNCTKSPSPAHVRLLAVQRADGSSQSDTVQDESSLKYLSSEQNWVSFLNMPHQMLVTNKSSPSDLLMASGRQKVLESLQSVSAHAESMEEPPPKYPQYAVKNMRINSFQGWSAELRQNPEEMAECGFYYAGTVGFNDCVRCFFCGVGLRNWMSEDDPWIEHARWSTECIYVLKMKGEEFVSLVKMAVEIAEREEAARSNGGGNLVLQNSNEATPAAVVKEASKDQTGNVGATDGNVVKGASSTLPPGNSEIQKYLLTDAAQSVLDMGYQPKLVMRAIERVLMKKGSEELTGEIIMEAVFEIDEEDKSQAIISSESSNKQVGQQGHEATGNTQLEESQIDPEKIMREHRELREVTLCKVCLENTSCVVFLPCGHLMTCSDCAPAMRKCPICRTLIKGTVKTFYG